MRRIFGDFAYGPGPRTGCWWDETCEIAPRPELSDALRVDVAIIGAGFTGLTAARELARAGLSVAVLEMDRIGWGASGRNGGFCCLGGGKASDAELDARYGSQARRAFRMAERAAVEHVEQVVNELGLDVDRHSTGETEIAHSPGAMAELRAHAGRVAENYGVAPTVIEPGDLATAGMGGGPFHGAVTIPIGFALNPRKYLRGLAAAAEAAGARIFENTAVQRLQLVNGTWHLSGSTAPVSVDKVIVATNGYSSEDLPGWLRARFMPAQSTVLVTRPMLRAELEAQGWTSDQMSYDSRNLLHYFRLMPDRRFLFGMRGAVLTGPKAEARARGANRRHFERMFPAWAGVETTHTWSGFVSLARNKVPFVGEMPHHQGLWTAMCYHGNGVAMGSYCGKLVADMLRTGDTEACPVIMRQPLATFPFGALRRLLMPPLYAGLRLADLGT